MSKKQKIVMANLCERGILNRNLPVPKNFDTLEKYILECQEH